MAMFSSRTLVTRFHEYSRRRRLIGENSSIIVAVSGGVDSTVLLDLIAKERDALGLRLIVAHFNHQLRGDESDGDEQFVIERARQYGLEAFVDRANTAEVARHQRLGIQEAARILRYDFFSKLLASSGYDAVATAHNADDNAETVLLHLFRGAGVQGLAGIPVLRQDRKVIRPLLFAPREEIWAYAAEEGIPFREDSSNDKDTYTRNLLRHQILPVVREQVNPNIVETLQRTSDLFRELDAFLAREAEAALGAAAGQNGSGIVVQIPRLKEHPAVIQQYVVMLAVQKATGSRPDHDDVERILRLTEGDTGSWVTIGDRFAVYRDRDRLVFRQTEEPAEYRIHVLQNHRYEFQQFRFATALLDSVPGSIGPGGGTEYVDADLIPPGHLVLRTWAEGDWFVPLGMKSRKKISDYFIDAKIPLYEKRNYPILETKDGTVIWVCGQRIDDRFKITEATHNVLRLDYRPAAEGPGGTDAPGER
jgi:tRNA(Ile)-lysidine synthase